MLGEELATLLKVKSIQRCYALALMEIIGECRITMPSGLIVNDYRSRTVIDYSEEEAAAVVAKLLHDEDIVGLKLDYIHRYEMCKPSFRDLIAIALDDLANLGVKVENSIDPIAEDT